jgi:hypothetical protein
MGCRQESLIVKKKKKKKKKKIIPSEFIGVGISNHIFF